MNVLYCRISTVEQKTDRQRINEKNYSLVIEDKCSGTVPFFEREGGKKIKMLLDKGALKQLDVLEIDRLGRDLRDIIRKTKTNHSDNPRLNLTIYLPCPMQRMQRMKGDKRIILL